MTGRRQTPWVWVTRAEPGASTTASRLKTLGFIPIVAPVIRTVPLDARAPVRSSYDALAFTSSAAVRRFAALSPSRDEAVFAVGDATAKTARAQGWVHVASADADVARLGEVLAREAKGMRILHPCAEVPAGDLAGFTKDVAVTALPVYATVCDQAGT
jgi:uroporphyrinogen-III synthase